MTQRYSGKTVAFLTQHGKEDLIAPMFQTALGCKVIRAEGYDTDLLGTFSGEIEREGTQLETARQKARIGMNLTGARLGIASEGAFVADPFGGLIPWNVELLIWIDDDHQLEIVGMAQGTAQSAHRALRDLGDLERFANEAGFPAHHLTLRPESDTDLRVRKGLSHPAALAQAFETCRQESSNGLVYAGNDHRAFCNPTRQSMIRLAAQDLLQKIQSHCPACAMPGFSITQHAAGLPCSLCHKPTSLAKSYTWQCASCDYQVDQPNKTPLADPSRCDVCNP